jgi:murein L,D-transpeptidase YafK
VGSYNPFVHRPITLLLLLSCALLCPAETPSVDRVVVYKAKRKMVLLSQGKQVKTYRIALGRRPVGPKRRQGDQRTPEGSYLLDFRNPNSQYYKSFHISYPSRQDAVLAKKRRVPPGGDIMLHGLPKGQEWVGKSHRLIDWTEGCIAVTNDEMDELWTLVHDGTPIDIKP